VARWTRSVVEVRAYFFRLMFFEGARVRFTRTHAELRQHVENLPALDFQLARKIVDSNLTHPPLFDVLPKAP